VVSGPSPVPWSMGPWQFLYLIIVVLKGSWYSTTQFLAWPTPHVPGSHLQSHITAKSSAQLGPPRPLCISTFGVQGNQTTTETAQVNCRDRANAETLRTYAFLTLSRQVTETLVQFLVRLALHFCNWTLLCYGRASVCVFVLSDCGLFALSLAPCLRLWIYSILS
jgi:hypothetical protein